MAVTCGVREKGSNAACGKPAKMEYHGTVTKTRVPVCHKHAAHLRERWGVQLFPLSQPKPKRKRK